MPMYVSLFRYKDEALKGMMAKPSDREAAVRQLAEAVGGRLHAMYLLFGQYDGVVIGEFPDSRAAAAVMVAVGGSGAVAHLETHEAIPASEATEIFEQANAITSSYRLPGT